MADISENLGARSIRPLPEARFPDVGQTLSRLPAEARPPGAADVLLVNPPAPDGGIWIRSQHRVGRRSREGMIWPQVSLAQLAAMLQPDYSVEIVDAIPLRMTWDEFERLLKEKRPKYYVTQVTAPTLTNDLRGTFLARSLGARTIAFGAHVTPLPVQTMEAFPTLNYVLRGEPELTLVELVDTFVVPSRGCPAGCTFCIKHVSYQYAVRVRSPQNVVAELKQLWQLGLRNVHMYADLFTVNREQVMGICQGLIDEGLALKWTCNSRVDYVDPEMLQMMARAGCWLIAWGIESANEGIRKRVHKGTRNDQIVRALGWSRAAGIMNWGYFIIGLPGETEGTVRQTIDLARRLPLDLALFHIAAPYPGTPFYQEAVEKGWFRPGTVWEEVDMDRSTVLDYPQMPAERIEYWARRAFREWALRPGPLWTFVKSMNSWLAFKSAVNVGWQALGWMR